jgi:hypothetical protein
VESMTDGVLTMIKKRVGKECFDVLIPTCTFIPENYDRTQCSAPMMREEESLLLSQQSDSYQIGGAKSGTGELLYPKRIIVGSILISQTTPL